MSKAQDTWQELYSSSLMKSSNLPSVIDFEQYRKVASGRIVTWGKYLSEELDEQEKWIDCFSWPEALLRSKFDFVIHYENLWYSTNKPNAQKALLYEGLRNELIRIGLQRKYIVWVPRGPYNSTYSLSPESIAALQAQEGHQADTQSYVFSGNFLDEKIHTLEAKDDELFPEPEPLRAEVAGSILSFTTWDAALVVYMDSEHKGKEVQIDNKSRGNDPYAYSWINEKQKVVERSVNGEVITAAIFPRIPLVNDELRHEQSVVKRVDCTVTFDPPSSNYRWKETITLFRENVTEVDWRGRSQ